MQSKRVSDLSGIPISTIRYYERAGLIPDKYIQRDANNYRVYEENLLNHLKDISLLLSSGFTINELRELMRDSNWLTHEEKLKRIGQKIDQLESQRKQIESSQAILRKLVNDEKVIIENDTWNCPNPSLLL
ncbi:MAG: MerR family transcriptional regulator [Enterococcus faecalis]